MDASVTFLALIVVLCCLNMVPWIFLCVKRPDRNILDQLEASDSALAGLFQHLLSRVDAVTDLAPSHDDNPIFAIIEMFLKQKMNNSNLIDRDESGQFNGTQNQTETQTTLDSDFFNGTR